MARMLRGHLASLLTLVFLALLVLVALSEPAAPWAMVLLGLLAGVVLVMYLATERVLHRGERRGP